jgi:hypothetical protein
MTYRGSCHCGQVRFEVDGELEQVMECNCSHCSRKGFLLWFVPRTAFRLQTPERALASYSFNKRVIEHRFCTRCGCQAFAFGKDAAGNESAAINVRCLEDVALPDLTVVPFDGRSL